MHQKIYIVSKNKHNYDCTNVTHIHTENTSHRHILSIFHRTNTACRNNIAEQIHIWTFLYLPIPQQRLIFFDPPHASRDKPALSCYHKFDTCNIFQRCVVCVYGWTLIPYFGESGFHLHKPH